MNHGSKISFTNVVNQSVCNRYLAKDDAFKGFMSIMYASHVRSGPVDHLMQANILSSFSIEDCRPISTMNISTATSKSQTDTSDTSFHGKCKTAASEASETPASDVIFLPLKQ